MVDNKSLLDSEGKYVNYLPISNTDYSPTPYNDFSLFYMGVYASKVHDTLVLFRQICNCKRLHLSTNKYISQQYTGDPCVFFIIHTLTPSCLLGS